MPAGLGIRTVWISLRAINYTDRAFKLATKNIANLEDKEKDLVKAYLREKDAARFAIQTNMLYAATLALTTQRVLSMLAATDSGQMHLSEFNEALEETKNAFADTLFTALRPLIDAMTGFLRVLSNNAPLRTVLVILAGLAVVGAALVITVSSLNALYRSLAATQAIYSIITGKQTIVQIGNLTITRAQVIAYTKLALAVGAAFGIFYTIFTLLKGINPIFSAAIAVVLALAAALIKLYIAESFATLGVAAVAGAAGAGLAAVTAATYGFQMGTRSAPYTGLAMIHKGEVVYNPATERPTQIAADIRRGKKDGSVTRQDVRINIDTVNTKSDIDDFNEKVSRTLRRGMRNNR